MPPEFHDLAKRVNNWGRWGPDDEIGTLNLVTGDVVRKAAACVRTGRRLSLAMPLSENGPQSGLVPGRNNPSRTMTSINQSMTGDPAAMASSDDVVYMGLQSATHWDSLAHASYDNRIYNGFGADTITAAGAARCGIDKVTSVMSRGVLLDVARAKGVDRLEPGYTVTADDLDAAAELAKVTVEPGDIVLIRTGQVQALATGDKFGFAYPSAGPGLSAVEWFRRTDIAAVATDNLTFEVFPCEQDMWLPVHLLDLVEMGLTQGQCWDLEALAADCADDGVYTFLLEASPLPFVGGLGSPVNPGAVK